MKQCINAENAPAAANFFSHAVKVGDFIYTSGQIGLDPETMKLVSDDVGEQTEQVIQNLSAILKASGSSLENVVKATIFLTDINDYASMNEVYAKTFNQNAPARSAVEVAALPLGAKVEIELVATV